MIGIGLTTVNHFPSPPINCTVGKAVTSSPTFSTFTANFAVDGITANNTNGRALLLYDSASTAFLEIDMGGMKNINRVICYWDAQNQVQPDYDLYYYKSGVKTLLASQRGNTLAQVTYDFPYVTTDKIRIEFPLPVTNTYYRIYEIEAYGY